MQLVCAAQIENSQTPVDLFESFWIICWRRQCKKDARKAWDAINPADHIEILTAACAWRPIFMARGDTSFTPLPATWLRGERWTDEIPAEFARSVIPASHGAAPTDGGTKEITRGAIPAHVQAVIDRLKAQRK